MANGIGGRIQKTAVGVLIGLLVIGFAVWGVNDVFTPQNRNAALSVGKVDVSLPEFEDAFRRELQMRGRESGQQMTNDEAYGQGVHNEILQRLLTDTVIGIDADELGIGVNRKSARKVVKEIPTFQDDITGEFSERKMEEILAQNRITRQDFENDVYQSLRRQQTVPAIVTGIEAPMDYAAQRYKFLTEQRKADVLTLTKDAVPTPATPDDETLKAYIDANAATYTAPEYRRITMLRIEPYDLIPDIEVSEEQIRASFDYQIELGRIGAPETRSVVQVTATDEATAQMVVDQINAGVSAEEAATGLGLIEPITYTDVDKDGIFDPETADIAFTMNAGEAQTVLGSLGNWYAIVVTAINAADIPDYEAQKPEIKQALLEDLAEEKIYDETGGIEDAIGEGLTLEEVSETVGRGLSSIDFIDRQGHTPDGIVMDGYEALPGVARDTILLTEIFSNDIGYQTDLFQTSNGGWATIRVDDVRDSALKNFEDVREDATEAWTSQQIDEALTALSQEISTQVRDGKTLREVNATLDNGATLSKEILVRSDRNPNVGGLVAFNVMDGKKGDIERGDGPAPLTKQVAVLTDIISNNDGLAGQFADSMQEQMTNAISGDLQNAYQAAIIKENPLREYQDNIRQTLGINTP